ncbi:MAG: hypothetical protein HOW73_12990 [Polyangiaceae bacterium]|nr:hypothetical protein [Polyangiaceae bacterium]
MAGLREAWDRGHRFSLRGNLIQRFYEARGARGWLRARSIAPRSSLDLELGLELPGGGFTIDGRMWRAFSMPRRDGVRSFTSEAAPLPIDPGATTRWIYFDSSDGRLRFVVRDTTARGTTSFEGNMAIVVEQAGPRAMVFCGSESASVGPTFDGLVLELMFVEEEEVPIVDRMVVDSRLARVRARVGAAKDSVERR